jgi:hypothetical protein
MELRERQRRKRERRMVDMRSLFSFGEWEGGEEWWIGRGFFI